jgi:hypothetical protein
MGRLVMASTPRAYRHLHAPAPSGVYADKRCIVPATKAAECTDGRACPRPWRSLRAFRRMPTRQGIRRSIWFTKRGARTDRAPFAPARSSLPSVAMRLRVAARRSATKADGREREALIQSREGAAPPTLRASVGDWPPKG